MAVTLHTDLGDLKLELFCDKCPRTCEVCKIGYCTVMFAVTNSGWKYNSGHKKISAFHWPLYSFVSSFYKTQAALQIFFWQVLGTEVGWFFCFGLEAPISSS